MDEPPVAAREACLRCGDFLGPGLALLPGIPLCRECFAVKRTRGRFAATVPPGSVGGRRLAVVVPCMAVGAAAGIAVGLRLALAPYPLSVFLAALIGTLAGELAPLLLGSRILQLGMSAWKRDVLAWVGLEAVAPERFVFGRLTHGEGTRALLLESEMALVLVGPTGLAVLGNAGTRLVLPFARLGEPTLGPARGAVRRLGLRLALGADEWTFVCFEGPTFAATRAAAEALASRVRAGFAAARGGTA